MTENSRIVAVVKGTKKGEPFALPGAELCRTNERACTNRFTLKIECTPTGGILWSLEKGLGKTGSQIRIKPLSYSSNAPFFPGLITAGYAVNAPWPGVLSKRNERSPRGGYDEQARRTIHEGGIKGIIETEIIHDVNPGPGDTTVINVRQSAKGFLYSPGLSVMVDYNEYHPYTSSLQAAEELLKSFFAVHARDGRSLMEAAAIPSSPVKPTK